MPIYIHGPWGHSTGDKWNSSCGKWCLQMRQSLHISSISDDIPGQYAAFWRYCLVRTITWCLLWALARIFWRRLSGMIIAPSLTMTSSNFVNSSSKRHQVLGLFLWIGFFHSSWIAAVKSCNSSAVNFAVQIVVKVFRPHNRTNENFYFTFIFWNVAWSWFVESWKSICNIYWTRADNPLEVVIGTAINYAL